MNTSPRDRKAFPSCFQVSEHQYAFSFSEIYLCIHAKNLIFPSSRVSMLFSYLLYCYYTVEPGLGSGFHCSDFFEKISLCKAGMQVSILLPSSSEQCMQYSAGVHCWLLTPQGSGKWSCRDVIFSCSLPQNSEQECQSYMVLLSSWQCWLQKWCHLNVKTEGKKHLGD